MAIQTGKLRVDPYTPGYDTLMNLAEEAMSPVYVTDLKPIDVSYIKDTAMRAVVALAASCQWNIVHKPGRQVTMISRTGFKQSIPTNTSIKYGVFLNRLGAINTHSFTHLPTAELIDKLLNQYKLDASHARAFRLLVESVPTEPQADEDTDEDEFTEQGDASEDEAEGHAEEDDMHPEIPDSQLVPYSERVEPTLSLATKGQQYVSQVMETVIRRLVPNGEDQITYRCLICGLEYPSKRGVGSHWQVHVQAGEATSTVDARKNIVNVIPNYKASEVHPRGEPKPEFEIEVEWTPPEPEPMTDEEWEPFIEAIQEPVFDDELTRLRDIISQVAALVSGDVARERDEALAELQDLRRRFDALQQTLSTLYELLGELNPTTKEKP